MDLVVFPEYSLHGLSMDTNPEIMCRLDGPEVAAFKQACIEQQDLGLLLDHGAQPGRQSRTTPASSSTTTARSSSTTASSIPGCRSSRGSPATSAFPVIDGPKGAKLALIICHDGMFPEMARECAYKGAEIMLRTAGYTAPIRDAWRFTNQANAFQNLMVTANVCMCGCDGTLRFDGRRHDRAISTARVMADGTTGRADEIITAEVRPDLVREARTHWAVENNIYQLWHRGYVAVKGGAMDCPYTFMQDMVAGQLPAAVGRRGRADRRHVVRLRPRLHAADATRAPRATHPLHAAACQSALHRRRHDA